MRQDTETLQWIPVATLGDLWEGDITDVQVGDELILLVHLAGGKIRAYQGYCPHQKRRSSLMENSTATFLPVQPTYGSSICLREKA
jgi:nitrite reductase/ring-hydroxylating ferredoxin subunit